MMKLILSALCACIASLGGAYGAMKYKSAAARPDEQRKEVKLETQKTRMISVPIIRQNDILGYIVARLEFVVDAALLKANGIPAESYVADEAFKIIYGRVANDFKSKQRQDLEAITASVAESVNKRMGNEVIKHVLVDSWTFLKSGPGGKVEDGKQH